MGKHSQRRFAATLPGRSLRRRSPYAVMAALATVAVTATAGAASMTTSPTGSHTSASSASAPTTSAAGPTASTPEEQAALDAASTQLVRAEYLASEGASSLTPDQLAQITSTRDQLRQLMNVATTATSAADATTATLDATTDTALVADTALDAGATLDTSATLDDATPLAADETLDGRDTYRASRAGADGREPLTTDGTTEASETAADAAATSEETAAADATADQAAADATADQAAADQAQVAPTTTEIGAATEALRTVLDAAAVTVSVQPAPTAEEIAAQQAAEEAARQAAMAAQLEAWANSTAGYSNGTIPESLLCSPSFAPGHLVRCDAAYQLEQLNVAYRAAFGTDISVTSSYRSFASQVAVKASKGYLAAAPGTSNHGMGQALDLGGGISSFGSAQYAWMRANAPAYGWDNPEWARQGGSKPEAWHWEYGTTY
ncbi:M15 family metallopeptidase [Oerskovia douganii]|nr:M15 family metallopeptidase [Oerskovia douganii]